LHLNLGAVRDRDRGKCRRCAEAGEVERKRAAGRRDRQRAGREIVMQAGARKALAHEVNGAARSEAGNGAEHIDRLCPVQRQGRRGAREHHRAADTAERAVAHLEHGTGFDRSAPGIGIGAGEFDRAAGPDHHASGAGLAAAAAGAALVGDCVGDGERLATRRAQRDRLVTLQENAAAEGGAVARWRRPARGSAAARDRSTREAAAVDGEDAPLLDEDVAARSEAAAAIPDAPAAAAEPAVAGSARRRATAAPAKASGAAVLPGSAATPEPAIVAAARVAGTRVDLEAAASAPEPAQTAIQGSASTAAHPAAAAAAQRA
jgi:hypothetical protein